MSKKWKHKDLWRISCANFTVEITRHSVKSFINEGYSVNAWCIYGYIYPEHPVFSKIEPNGSLWQEELNNMMLHGGCSFLKTHKTDDGKITSIQIGCDYSHEEDEYFSNLKTKKEAKRIFSDAEKLINWLNSYKERSDNETIC